MRCPYCHAPDSRVIDSRELSGGSTIRRRRTCANCGRRFTTYERVESAGLIVVKKDGRRQEFDPDKLRRFREFVNADAQDDNVVFVRERGQIRPATTREKRELIASV